MGVDAVTRAVFFDRDGVLNEADVREGRPYPPSSVRSLRIVHSAPAVVRRVREMGFVAIAVTNQPDVARGSAARQSVEEINAAVARELRLDAVYCCFHDDSDDCDCRKPRTGLLLKAAADFGIDLRRSYMVGDRVKDVECGLAAGCTTIFIERGYAETPAQTGADATVRSLEEAAGVIGAREGVAT